MSLLGLQGCRLHRACYDLTARQSATLSYLVVGHRRFIPARAGNALVHAARRSAAPVHPRASGERGCSVSRQSRMAGSSPRERGTHPATATIQQHPRFIPARAGNAAADAQDRAAARVHPRASGERSCASVLKTGMIGSSPRERGTRTVAIPIVLVGRFIPARAGNAWATSI